MSRITYPVVWVGEILRAVVEGFKVKGLLLVKGDHFGERSCVILTEHLTLSVTRNRKSKVRLLRRSQQILYLQAS